MYALGGNAVDAAVAAAFAVIVAEMVVSNIGAGGYGMVFDPKQETNQGITYDFFSTMPSGDVDCDLDFRKVLIDFGGDKQPFFIGRASTAVPGVVAGLCRMAREQGTLPLSTLMTPAIRLAGEGYPVEPMIAYVLDLLIPIYSDTPRLKALFQSGDRFAKVGDRLRFRELAETLEQISALGDGYYYRGALAEAIVDDHRRQGGLIRAKDLDRYEVVESRPIRVSYRGHEVLLPPPSSVGGVLVAFSLRLLDSVSLRGLEPGRFEICRILAHVMLLTNLARHSWDRGVSEECARVEAFLDDDFVLPYCERLAAILAGRMPPPNEPLSPQGPSSTTHISAIDADGMAVSVTTSAGEAAGYLVGDTGMILNNMLGEQDLNPLGFHRFPAGKRMNSMMCPIVVLSRGRPVLAVGSAGSNRLRSAIMQSVVNAIDFGLPLEEVVNRPRVHFENGILQMEHGFDAAVVERLRADGFRVNAWEERNLYFGGVQAVSLRDGRLEGAGDPRRGGHCCIV
ncbi:Gamma-glutamyltransferase [Sulfidibacter corallicola]